MHRWVVLLSALVASCVAAKTFVGQCPKIKGMQPFQPMKIAGDWYYISGNDLELGDEHCTKAHITVDTHCGHDNDVEGDDCAKDNSGHHHCDSNSYTYNWAIEGLDDHNQVVKHRGIIQNNKHGLSSLGVGALLPGGSSIWSYNYDANYVATDYANYMVIVFCWTIFDPSTFTFESQTIGRIFGRHPTLSEDIVKTLTNQIAAFNIDVTNHKLQDNSKCGW